MSRLQSGKPIVNTSMICIKEFCEFQLGFYLPEITHFYNIYEPNNHSSEWEISFL